ncbi:MAG: hypothetical protein JWM32_170 [Verrucomicrobia bacterium]|nr:hypothetical protein [Verrucomicrobiota bacterium]
MKIRLLVLSCVIPLISTPAVRAVETKPAAEAATIARVERPQTELEKVMTKISKAWRQVRKAARDGTLSPAMANVVTGIRVDAERAAKLTPALEAEKPAPERVKFQADYEAQMKKLVETLTALETALKANDIASAANLVGDVGDQMKSGHHDFKKPDERRW